MSNPTSRRSDRRSPAPSRSGAAGLLHTSRAATRWAGLVLGSLLMLVPMYVLVVNAFKDQDDIQNSPFGLPLSRLTLAHVQDVLDNPDFDLVKAYGVTLLFVVVVNVLSLAVCGPVSYVIARGRGRRHVALLLMFVAGTFIPNQVLLIPVVFVLKTLGLMGTVPGFVLFETCLTIPFSVFLYAAYIRTIPRELDEAAAIDGAGRIGTFWRIVFPLMRPVVATAVILHSLSIWNDFVTPQIILGPGSGLYTVTTGVYAAIGQYSTNYTVVFPNLLLAIAPALAFFIVMQRYIVNGLTSGATKG
ncbi:carbohydrate ABC transporter permease [Embleya scabrispora]|uniref:carbohydrate ABC transporter permease n=1 Tax=Embleya scabrispora TaxID=159449 RepID=UPI00037562C1|nr:carbohydrate ABC transporter permease [Embleya scabrispora]MYS87748.1 ABC transporter permease subunit [Streptomyces sp. SID5474]